MNGLMASLIILLLAGTAIGQQATDDAANTMPVLRPLPGANSMSAISTDNQFERPGPDDSVEAWPTPESVLGDQSTVTSSSMATGGQTNFGGRSERQLSPQATRSQSQGIRFDVMLRPQDLESVKRGGTLVAPVDIRDQQNEMLSTDVVSDIAFFHEANRGKEKTPGIYIFPEQIQPGSRKLRFKMTGEQLNKIDRVAYQFQVPANMRGEFDEVEFYTEDVVVDNRSNGTDLSGSWNTPNNSASNLPRPNDAGNRFGSLRRENADNGFGRDLKQPVGNDFGDLASQWERKNNGSANKPFDTNPGGRFGTGENGLGQQASRQDSPELIEMRRKLEETERLARQALADRKLWKDESLKLANEKSFLAKQKQQLETQLDATSRSGNLQDGSLMRPLDTKPFGSDRNNFAPVNSGQDPQLDLALKKIEQLERENQLAKRENQALAADYGQLEPAAKDLLGKYKNETSRRRSSDTTDFIRNTLNGQPSLAGTNPAGPRFANRDFEPTMNNTSLTGAGGTNAPPNTSGNQNVGNPKLGSANSNNRNKTTSDTKSQRSKTEFALLWLLLILSVGLNLYLSILCRSLYVRYHDLGDELREMFSATSA